MAENRLKLVSPLNLQNQAITNLLDPVNAQDAATRAFVLANSGGGTGGGGIGSSVSIPSTQSGSTTSPFQLSSNISYVLETRSDAIIMRLPENPSDGDVMYISNNSGRTDASFIGATSGENIMGRAATASNLYDLNIANANFAMVYNANSTQGWRIILAPIAIVDNSGSGGLTNVPFGTAAGQVATWAEGNNTDVIPHSKTNGPRTVSVILRGDHLFNTNTIQTGITNGTQSTFTFENTRSIQTAENGTIDNIHFLATPGGIYRFNRLTRTGTSPNFMYSLDTDAFFTATIDTFPNRDLTAGNTEIDFTPIFISPGLVTIGEQEASRDLVNQDFVIFEHGSEIEIYGRTQVLGPGNGRFGDIHPSWLANATGSAGNKQIRITEAADGALTTSLINEVTGGGTSSDNVDLLMESNTSQRGDETFDIRFRNAANDGNLATLEAYSGGTAIDQSLWVTVGTATTIFNFNETTGRGDVILTNESLSVDTIDEGIIWRSRQAGSTVNDARIISTNNGTNKSLTLAVRNDANTADLSSIVLDNTGNIAIGNSTTDTIQLWGTTDNPASSGVATTGTSGTEMLTVDADGTVQIRTLPVSSGGGGSTFDFVEVNAQTTSIPANNVAYISAAEQYWNVSGVAQGINNFVPTNAFTDTAFWRQLGDGGGGLLNFDGSRASNGDPLQVPVGSTAAFSNTMTTGLSYVPGMHTRLLSADNNVDLIVLLSAYDASTGGFTGTVVQENANDGNAKGTWTARFVDFSGIPFNGGTVANATTFSNNVTINGTTTLAGVTGTGGFLAIDPTTGLLTRTNGVADPNALLTTGNQTITSGFKSFEEDSAILFKEDNQNTWFGSIDSDFATGANNSIFIRANTPGNTSSTPSVVTSNFAGIDLNARTGDGSTVDITNANINFATTGRGIIFQGNTGGNVTSNILDDYEEGTWTPTRTGGGNLAAASGTYTKTGNTVYLEGTITGVTATGTATLRVSDIPFAADTSSSQPIGSYYIGGAEIGIVIIETLFNTTLGFVDTNNAFLTLARASDRRVDFSITYKTTA